MTKSKLLFLDANIIIELMRRGIWEVFLERCNVYLAESVVGEVHTTPTSFGIGNAIDLHAAATQGRLTIVSAAISETKAFQTGFTKEYVDKFDPGELESLTILCDSKHDSFQICSADAIVYKTLGLLGRREQAASLAIILKSIGLEQRLDHQYQEAYMNKHLDSGFQDHLGGFGRK